MAIFTAGHVRKMKYFHLGNAFEGGLSRMLAISFKLQCINAVGTK